MQLAVKETNHTTFESPHSVSAPILKWVGGKSQLLPILNQHYPKELVNGNIQTYIEPFVGGGAVYFNIFNQYNIQKAFLFDVNPELVLLYNSLKQDVESVILEVTSLQDQYLALENEEERKAFFYTIRELYNAENNFEKTPVHSSDCNPRRSAQTIFLNRTCFNGLFRVNSRGLFNVPHGRYKNPTIAFPDKLRAAAFALQKATIKQADFAECKNCVDGNTFIYYDPPYRPINKTSDFTSYSKESFGDDEQIRLANIIGDLRSENTFQLMSNSDPTNYVEDTFFDDLYEDFTISRVDAKRMINSDSSKRGSVREILVKDY